jgi:hypothetical protein
MSFFRWLCSALVLLALTCFAVLPVTAQVNSTPIPEDDYWELVQSSRETVSHLKTLPDEQVTQELADLALRWESVSAVEAGGRVTPVDSGYLVQLLRADPPDLEKIDGFLSVLQDARTAHPKQVFSTAELTPLHDILSRPEFAWPEQAPNPVNEWFQKLWDAINLWLDKIFGGGAITIPVNMTWMTIIAAALLAAVLFFAFRTLVVDFMKEAQIKGGDDGESKPLTSETAFEKAQSLSRGGDYRSAVRYLYLSSLLLMDERGVLRYDRSKTNREYLRSVSNSPEFAKPLEEVIEVFDNVWYGYHSLEEDTFKHYSDRVQELKDKRS